MRLMLGYHGEPSLLVSVDEKYKPTNFNFRVVNGAWDGKFTDGHVTVLCYPGGAFSDLDITEIICTDQDRLRGDYQTVFYNFDNPDYVAPEQKTVYFDDIDDDIPF